MAGAQFLKWFGGLFAIAVATAGCRNQPPEYQTSTVTRGELVQAVTASGTLQPVTNVQVGSQISGIILKLYADFNSPVKAGQVVAQLDPATYKANLGSAEANLASARANLELAQSNARRDEELFKAKLIASYAYEQTMATLHQAEAQVKINEASVERAKVDLSRCTIYAPVDGVVISRNVDVGQTVAASMSAPVLFQIANDLSQMQINAAVAEADVGGIQEGQEVEFTVDAFMYTTFTGRVTQVRNAAVVLNNVVTYDTIIDVSNPDLKLKPGMTANVSIILQRRENVLRIPNSALRFRPPVVAATARTNATPQTFAQGSAGTGGERGAGGVGGRRRGGGGSGGAGFFAGGGGGGRGGPGFGGGGGRPRPDRATLRTVYLMTKPEGEKASDPALRPVQVRVGISDGILTEVLQGLDEGDTVVVGTTTPTLTAQQPAMSNPLGGGRGGRGFRGF